MEKDDEQILYITKAVYFYLLIKNYITLEEWYLLICRVNKDFNVEYTLENIRKK